MKRTRLIISVAAATLWPGAVSACDLYLAYGPTRLHAARISLGGGVHVFPGEGHTVTGYAPSVDLRVRVGERMVVQPTVGYCSYAEYQQLVVGSGMALYLTATNAWWLGVQGHAAFVDFGRESTITLPVMAVGGFSLGDRASAYAGVGVRFIRFSFEFSGGSMARTESDPAAFAGITIPVGSLEVSGGVVVVRGDEDVQVVSGGGGGGWGDPEWSFGTAVRLPLGVS
jgi:hypothetical protein